MAADGHTYAWDAASGLVTADGATLTYYGLGDLRTRSEAGQTVHYYYNGAFAGNPIVAERAEGSGKWLRFYVWSPSGELVYLIDAEHTPAAQPAETAVAASEPTAMPDVAAQITAVKLHGRRSPWLAPTVLSTTAVILLGVLALGYRFIQAPKSALTHSHSIGQLEVLYVEKSQQMLERMVQETRRLVTSLAGLNTHPSRLIVNMSPGFYELRCLRNDGHVNWLKIHRSQVNVVSNETLQGCLR